MKRLGATVEDGGVSFAVLSTTATAVEVELPDDRRFPLERERDGRFLGHVPGITHGQRYGLRVSGQGKTFDPNVRLLDPWARAVSGERRRPWGVAIDDRREGLEGDEKPATKLEDTVIYEAHVKGMTQLHPRIDESLRGRFGGLSSEPVVAHLKHLGVTAVELLPVTLTLDDDHLRPHGLVNYWGYQPLSFFAVDPRFSELGDGFQSVVAFRRMVRTLHRAGLEVILDLVFNHTGEGGGTGPATSLRGIDDQRYYRHARDGSYVDVTGCGNSIDASSSSSVRLIMDALRFWVTEMSVDGFRFDLATTLGRVADHSFDPRAPLLSAMLQDPIVNQVKLIAEPWDVGAGGYQVGGFPAGFSEWNGKYRDAVRRFWGGYDLHAREFAGRMLGSSDLYGRLRGPLASVNFVTAHDGFTMRDLVTYQHRRNLDNGEEGRDGESNNLGFTFGLDGESVARPASATEGGVPSLSIEARAERSPSETSTKPLNVEELRLRQVKNFLATLLLSSGVPMLLGGDELFRTQKGNNNAYCQDNELSWFSWVSTEQSRELTEFVRLLLALRRREPSLRRRVHFDGNKRAKGFRDAHFFRPDDRHEMTQHDWHAPHQTFVMRLDGTRALYFLFNASSVEREFLLAPTKKRLLFDTATRVLAEDRGPSSVSHVTESLVVSPHSLVVLERVDG